MSAANVSVIGSVGHWLLCDHALIIDTLVNGKEMM